jgi:hypothetical protein
MPHIKKFLRSDLRDGMFHPGQSLGLFAFMLFGVLANSHSVAELVEALFCYLLFWSALALFCFP